MDYREHLFEPIGYGVAFTSFFFSLFFFYFYSADLYYSALGAFLAALMIWLSYVILRLLYMASR